MRIGQSRCQEIKTERKVGGLIDGGNLDLMKVTEDVEHA